MNVSVKEPKPATTVIEANIDVGDGNRLFIRGEGGGLSWDKGQPLSRIGRATWVWSGHVERGEIVFKLLLNDEIWCMGENIHVGAGHKIEVVPAF